LQDQKHRWLVWLCGGIYGPRIRYPSRACSFLAYVAGKVPLLWIQLWPYNQLAVCSRSPRIKERIPFGQNTSRLSVSNVEQCIG
ncbi:Os06g0622550, partial [Oryza sativa Japonica Group]